MYDFDFKGFVPDDSLEQFATFALRRMMEMAPYYSDCTAQISKQGNDYTVFVEIRTGDPHFTAKATTPDPRRSIDIVEQHINEQIARWHHGRFDQAA